MVLADSFFGAEPHLDCPDALLLLQVFLFYAFGHFNFVLLLRLLQAPLRAQCCCVAAGAEIL